MNNVASEKCACGNLLLSASSIPYMAAVETVCVCALNTDGGNAIK